MRKWITIVVVALVIIVPVGMRVVRGGEAKQVEIEDVSLRALAPSILASGTLTYESEVKLVPEVIGRVQKILGAEGDFVKQGRPAVAARPGDFARGGRAARGRHAPVEAQHRAAARRAW